MSPAHLTEREVLVIDRSPAIACAVRMACPGWVVRPCRSAADAARFLEQNPALILCDLSVEGIPELYNTAQPHLRRRFTFVHDGPCSEDMRAFLAVIGDPLLLYKPLSTPILQVLLGEAPRSARGGESTKAALRDAGW